MESAISGDEFSQKASNGKRLDHVRRIHPKNIQKLPKGKL
jgi:hypothetical protein